MCGVERLCVAQCKKKFLICDNDKNAQLDSLFQHEKVGKLGTLIYLRLFSYIFGCKQRTTIRKPCFGVLDTTIIRPSTELEVDILTGNNLMKLVDILEDVSESLSSYMGIGQIEGAFVMCLGCWLTEQLVYDRANGQLMTYPIWNYKLAGAKYIPTDFRIELLPDNPKPAGFLRLKATGEHPGLIIN